MTMRQHYVTVAAVLAVVVVVVITGSVAYYQHRDYLACKKIGGVAVRGYWAKIECVEPKK